MEAKIRELEEASRVFLAPPNLVSAEERQRAESVFLALRKTPTPYDFCHFILEHCSNDYVLFQAASTLKEAIVKEWSLLAADQIVSLRSSLLQYVTQHPHLQNFVREQLLATVAVIVKRSRLDTNEGSSAIFADIAQLVGSGDLSLQLIACSLLTALLNEYSSSSRASDVGLPWELHCKCKRAFEADELQQVLTFCLQVLSELEAQQTSREVTAVFNRVLAIVEQVLTWDFLPKHVPKHMVGSFVPEQNVSFRPPRKWSTVVLDQGLVQMMFKVHSKVRHHTGMATHSLQCLSQLASLNGAIFVNRDANQQYLSSYITTFLHFLSSAGNFDEQEALGVATIISRLFVFFPLRMFAEVPSEIMNPFLQSMGAVTLLFCQSAAKDQNDEHHAEALQKMLDAWSTVVSQDVGLDSALITQKSTEIFNMLIQSHLAPPEGSRSDEDNEEYVEQDEDDRELFLPMLTALGDFGRRVPAHSLPLLLKLLETRSQSLHVQLVNLKEANNQASLSGLFEDIHWLLLFAGHVMTNDAEGEMPMIPSDIMQYSIDQSKQSDCQASLAYLANSVKDFNVSASDSIDPVIRLTAAVLRLAAIESWAVENGLSGHLSPEMSASCMWMLKRWVRAYLLPDEAYYTQISMPLTMAFGRDTEGGQFVVSFLLDKVISNLQAWSSESELMKDTFGLMIALVDRRATCSQLVKCGALWSLAENFSLNRHPVDQLSVQSKRSLCQALVMAGSASFEDDANKNQYQQLELKSSRTVHGQISFSLATPTPPASSQNNVALSSEVLKSLERRLQAVMSQNDLRHSLHSERSRGEVLCLLDCLCGVSEASSLVNVQMLFKFMHPLLNESVNLLDVYHNYDEVVTVILELFSIVANQMICYLPPADSKRLFETVLSMMQTYAKHNIGRKSIGKDAEEEQFQDLLTLMDMLTNLLSKDFIDFAVSDEGKDEEISAADVVLFGLNIIVPVMTEELLKFPALCTAYMRLTTYLAEIYPHKICELPDQLLRILFSSVDLGLSNVSTDINKLCMEFLASISTHVFHKKLFGSAPHQALAHFLKSIFQMLLMQSFDMDLIETASETFFSLICCHQELYQELVRDLLSQQTNPDTHRRLLSAFTDLTPPSLQLNIQRSFKTQFRENFEIFLVNVRGFLCVK